MPFIHPVQDIVVDSANKQVYIVIKNTIVVYRFIDGEYKQVGKWVDTYKLDELEEQNKRKKAKNNAGEAVATTKKEIPIAEALSLNSNIRSLKTFNQGKAIVTCTDSNKGIAIFDVDLQNTENCLTLRKREQFAKRPNAITLTDDENVILMADKFGDVYSINTQGEPYDEKIMGERKPILGHVSMLTDILFKKSTSNNKDFVITTDRDEHIKVSNYPHSFVVDKWLFGHNEFISSIVSPEWKSQWLVSAGGDDSIFLWDWEVGKLLSTFNYTDLIQSQLTDKHLAAARFQNEKKNAIEYCVAKLSTLKSLPYVAFYVEATKILFILAVHSEKGTFSLKQTLDLPANIISLTQNEDIFSVSLDNHESGDKGFVKVIKFDSNTNSFIVDEFLSQNLDKTITTTLKNDTNLITESAEDMHPLYNIINLKKHGEHYS
ncbi:tRNA (guanine-N(7)-)-methyltransferase non-catalytic subunit Trm82p [Monosporozyma unispora]|nr:tRNA (guanine-N(7)-)-methyltransferase non-catalytic subunit trm82 [Kazachstania unispora]